MRFWGCHPISYQRTVQDNDNLKVRNSSAQFDKVLIKVLPHFSGGRW